MPRLFCCATYFAFSIPLTGCFFSPAGMFRSPEVIPGKTGPIRQASASSSDSKTIYLVGHGWHTGIIVKIDDVNPEIWPESRDFPRRRFLEIGWGDEGFYRANGITAGVVFRAAFLPTPSVMHVVGFDAEVEQVFASSDLIELQVTDAGFDALCRFIHDTFAADDDGRAVPLGPGL
ncbi:MAG: DUF2459 domain-containing protein, partial [Planctomycetes bacterium]|nr:DUF2459 domain-containing protein [Planctomycetota bacterium]